MTAGTYHENPIINKLCTDLEIAAQKDLVLARGAFNKFDKGVYTGRADAKRHVITQLIRVKM